MYQLADPTNKEMISKIQQKLLNQSEDRILWQDNGKSHKNFINDVIDIVKEKAEIHLGEEFPAMFNEKTRKREIVIMRQVATFIIRKHAPFLTLEVIAKAIGGLDHSTAIHSIRQVENLIEVMDYKFFKFTEDCIESVVNKWEVRVVKKDCASVLKKYL